MNIKQGWTGRMVTIDLSQKDMVFENIPEDWPRKYIGARGYGIRKLYDMTGPETNPLGPENVIIIAAGPLTG